MRLLGRVLTFFVALLLIIFSVMNRNDIEIVWSPVHASILMPAYLIFFIGIFIGLLAAAYATNWVRLKAFARARRAERHIAELEDENASLREELSAIKINDSHKVQTQQSD